MIKLGYLDVNEFRSLEIFLSALKGADDVEGITVTFVTESRKSQVEAVLKEGFTRWPSLHTLVLDAQMYARLHADMPSGVKQLTLKHVGDVPEIAPSVIQFNWKENAKMTRWPNMLYVRTASFDVMPVVPPEKPPRWLRSLSTGTIGRDENAANQMLMRLLKETSLEVITKNWLDGLFPDVERYLELKRSLFVLLAALCSPSCKACEFLKQDGDHAIMHRVAEFYIPERKKEIAGWVSDDDYIY